MHETPCTEAYLENCTASKRAQKEQDGRSFSKSNEIQMSTKASH